MDRFEAALLSRLQCARGRPLHVKTEIYPWFRGKFPEFCRRFSMPCVHGERKSEHPEWQHEVRWRLTHLGLRGQAEHLTRTVKGYWIASKRGRLNNTSSSWKVPKTVRQVLLCSRAVLRPHRFSSEKEFEEAVSAHVPKLLASPATYSRAGLRVPCGKRVVFADGVLYANAGHGLWLIEYELASHGFPHIKRQVEGFAAVASDEAMIIKAAKQVRINGTAPKRLGSIIVIDRADPQLIELACRLNRSGGRIAVAEMSRFNEPGGREYQSLRWAVPP